MDNLLPETPQLIVFVGIFAGALVAGFAGIGLAAASGAFLLHVMPPATAVPLMMICSILAQLAGILMLRKTVAFRRAVPFIIGGLFGVPIAVALLLRADAALLRAGFGLFLVLYAAQALAMPRLRLAPAAAPSDTKATGALSGSSAMPGRMRAGAVGFIGGVVGGLTAMPGAALSVWADIQGGDKRFRRAVVQPFIVVMQVFAIAILAASGRLADPNLVGYLLPALLPLALGTAAGLALFGRLSDAGFRQAILLLILVSGVGVLITSSGHAH